MRRFVLTIITLLFFARIASAQEVIPDLSFGIKGGANYSMTAANAGYKNMGQFGYIGGGWVRFGGLGFIFQPEVYLTSKNVKVSTDYGGINYTNQSKLTSFDVPLLVGYKTGSAGFGIRVYTGPALSFALNKSQSYTSALSEERLSYADQSVAWQFGAGVDISDFSFDARYEAGISKVAYGSSGTSTHLNLVSITISYAIFSTFSGMQTQ